MKKKKIIITSIVTIIMAVAAAIFGITYTDEDVEKISEGIETVVKIIENESTQEIPEAYIEDEIALEEQEVESESFEIQGEIAYNGSTEFPNVQLGEYAGLTYYSQIDSRWKNLPYTAIGDETQTIGSSACGPTCAAMVVSSIKGTILPPDMCNLFLQNGFRSANNGTYWSAFRWTADVFDFADYKEIYKLNEVCDLLEENYMVIAACGNGLFTTGGHFILVYGYEDTNGSKQCDAGDRLKVYDPYLYSGKFNTSTRRGKAQVEGNTVYVEKEVFRNNANYSIFFAFKNDRKENNNTEAVDKKPVTTATYTRYVKVNSSLNVRSGPGTNYKYVKSLYNGDQVTVYSEQSNWSNIGTSEWVCSDYLTDSNVKVKNTVGETRKLKSTTTLYSKSDLSGTRYTYLPNTKVTIKNNISSTVDYIYVPATGRWAYVSTSAYAGTSSGSSVSKSLEGTTQKFKWNTTVWKNSSMSGTYYTYLPNTSVKVLDDLGSIDYIKVPATGRYGYVYESVYK